MDGRYVTEMNQRFRAAGQKTIALQRNTDTVIKAPAMKRNSRVLLFFVVLLTLTSVAQESKSGKQAPTSDLRLGPMPTELTAEQKGEAKRVADVVARLFKERRNQAKLPYVWRFHCSVMQQVACSSAQSGKAERSGRNGFQAMYWTDEPEKVSPELEKVATWDTRPKENGGFAANRFSIVVWPTTRPKGYWIGIDLHPNALAEEWNELKVYFETCDGPCP